MGFVKNMTPTQVPPKSCFLKWRPIASVETSGITGLYFQRDSWPNVRWQQHLDAMKDVHQFFPIKRAGMKLSQIDFMFAGCLVLVNVVERTTRTKAMKQ